MRNFDPKTFESDFNERLILQKTVYLMQSFGCSLGYPYNWYLRGPYSPALTKDAYTSLVNKFDESPPARFQDEEVESRFKQFLSFLKDRETDHVWLEKVASIHFLSKTYPSKSEEEIFKEVKAKVSSLTRTEFKAMWEELSRFGLLRGAS